MVGYGRVSTDEEKQLDSLEKQIEFFSEFARIHGYHLVHVYADEGISGKQLKKRDQFLKMLSDAESGQFGIVVVKDVSRFARNTVDLLTSVRKLKFLGVDVLFVNNNQKLLGESEFIITLLGAMAQEESANLSKRVKFGKEINSRKGRVPPKIYGYDRIDNFTLRIQPEEAEVVKEVYRLYTEEGLGCRSIAAELERQGAKTKLGGRWSSSGVRRILENPIYSGTYVNHRYTVIDFLEGTIRRLPEEAHYIHDRAEWAIVTKEQFRKAQDIMALRRRQYHSGNGSVKGRYSSRHLFSTLLKCASCGRSFTRKCVQYTNSQYIYWRCPTNSERSSKCCPNNTIIREEELTKVLADYLSTILPNRELTAKRIALRCRDSWGTQGHQEEEIRRLDSKKKRLHSQMEKYMDLYADDLLPVEALRGKIEALRKDLTEVERKLSEAKSTQGKEAPAPDLMSEALDAIDSFLSLKSVTNMDLRRILSRITVSQDRQVTIYLKAAQDADG